MRKYLFIPITLESTLKAQQDAWLAQNGAYMVCTGVYKEKQDTPNSDNSTIKDQSENLIPCFVSDVEENTNSKLIGFCVEANESDLPNPLPEGVEEFNSAREFIDYKENL